LENRPRILFFAGAPCSILVSTMPGGQKPYLSFFFIAKKQIGTRSRRKNQQEINFESPEDVDIDVTIEFEYEALSRYLQRAKSTFSLDSDSPD